MAKRKKGVENIEKNGVKRIPMKNAQTSDARQANIVERKCPLNG